MLLILLLYYISNYRIRAGIESTSVATRRGAFVNFQQISIYRAIPFAYVDVRGNKVTQGLILNQVLKRFLTSVLSLVQYHISFLNYH